MSDDEVLRHWSTVAGAWESYRDRLFTDVRSVSDWLLDAVDPQPGQTVLELAAGPDSLEPDRVDAVRSTLGPSIEPFERDGALEIPWTATVTRMG